MNKDIINGWMNEWMIDGWMDERRIDWKINGWIEGCVTRQTDDKDE